ncbi:MAG: alanine glycine permease [Alphaproteobacteria bacterium]|nr:MAG: alanine glycine permease [Alphaproteobacteria bacterium]
MQIDQWINTTLTPLSEALSSVVFYSIPLSESISVPVILLWLVAISLFTTVYFGFVNIRSFGRGVGLAAGRIHHKEDAKAEGQITPFQALATTLSATVGLGNIAGVAIAISIGGPGAIVWMILMGVLGMSTKFHEASLGVMYRKKSAEGIFSGGPMYYLRDGLSDLGWPKIGKILAAVFAVCCIGGALGAGNMFQVNQVYQQLVNVTGGSDISFWADKGWMFGLGMAFLVGVVIIGGIKSIASVASKVVPLMALIYMAAGFVVIAMHASAIPDAFLTIFDAAFSMEAGFGGLIGGIIQGVRRAAFSNEAGIGSAAITHAVAKTSFPVAQGMVAMLGAFVDTVIICLMTALVIVISGVGLDPSGAIEGISLTSRAFETVMPWFPPVLAFIVFLFAYSTMLTWSYYGLKSVTYLMGDGKCVDLGYKIVFCGFVVLGSSASLDIIINLSDSMYFAMAVPNIIALYLLAPKVKRALGKYKNMMK